MNEFAAWMIGEVPVTIDVPASPIGPISVRSWRGRTVLPAEGSAVILPIRPMTAHWPAGPMLQLVAGCYAVVPGGAVLGGGEGLIIQTPRYCALAQAGGPVEAAGRLRYIDGCSDTLLVCPPKVGEPCLNLLHLPPGIDQTAHTHPSDRIGIILRGRGVCQSGGLYALRPGMFWYIPAGCVHSFHTEDESLDVFAWHPDSDFGPSHDFHPMLNRTIVDGVSANDARHEAIRTTGI